MHVSVSISQKYVRPEVLVDGPVAIGGTLAGRFWEYSGGILFISLYKTNRSMSKESHEKIE